MSAKIFIPTLIKSIEDVVCRKRLELGLQDFSCTTFTNKWLLTKLEALNLP